MKEEIMESKKLKDSFFNEFITNLYYVLNLHKSVSKRTKKSILLTMKDAYTLNTCILVEDEEDGLIHPKVLEA